VLQAVLYELGAIALTGPIVGLSFDVGAGSSLLLAVIMSSIALAWNYVFNAGFEHWERRQVRRQRTVWRRLMHGIGFEGGLGLMLVPLMAVWLDIPLWQALVAEIGLLALFFLYAVGFTWAFDRVFGLPESARG
jgi:uncharacterized membrane protein